MKKIIAWSTATLVAVVLLITFQLNAASSTEKTEEQPPAAGSSSGAKAPGARNDQTGESK